MCLVECAPSARRVATTSVTTCSSVPRPPSTAPWPGSTSMLQTSATSKQDTVGSLDTVVRASYRAKGEALGSLPTPTLPRILNNYNNNYCCCNWREIYPPLELYTLCAIPVFGILADVSLPWVQRLIMHK